jgi:hypothetical protein
MPLYEKVQFLWGRKNLPCYVFHQKNTQNHAVTFALLAVERKQTPWNSNIIKHLMGEIPKNYKWMH